MDYGGISPSTALFLFPFIAHPRYLYIPTNKPRFYRSIVEKSFRVARSRPPEACESSGYDFLALDGKDCLGKKKLIYIGVWPSWRCLVEESERVTLVGIEIEKKEREREREGGAKKGWREEKARRYRADRSG